jgi:hypothetical protein
MVWYGWDSRTETWHGPNALDVVATPARRLLLKLQTAMGHSWYGPIKCSTPGEPEARFFALIHDLSDCALAMIYCDESRMGPAEILVTIPADRRAQLRPDFAFEFLAFTRFLGSISGGAELQIHDGVEAAIKAAGPGDTLVFSVSTGMWPHDMDHVLSRCVEKVAVAMYHWLQATPVAV